MRRILICGSNGLLGQRLSLLLGNQTDYEVLNTSHHRSFVLDHLLFDFTQLNITCKSDTKSLVSSFQPDVILNAAAATNVDWCETHREETWQVNVVGVENLIDAAKKVGAHLVHVSTDYVFDGKNGPYSEDDRPNPLSYYGKSKLAGENALRASGIPHTILRTIVVYGYGIRIKPNFALWVISNLVEQKPIQCVDDQFGNPTYVGDLAAAIITAFETRKTGLYHICGGERVSRYDFAVQIARTFGFNESLIARIPSEGLRQVAPRPMVTGFITLKAETELNFKPSSLAQGLSMLKRELEIHRRR
jgi:dTDP-4-dehydrorhamnose reductase